METVADTYVQTTLEEQYRLALKSIIRWTDEYWAADLVTVVNAVSVVAKIALKKRGEDKNV